MAAGLCEQIEGKLSHTVATCWGECPWRVVRSSNRDVKWIKHRAERRRAKADPECHARYRRYHGWEW